MKKSNLITGIGSALVDILAMEDDEFLKKSGAEKGGMLLIDKKEIDHLISQTTSEPIIVPGGSACNTIIGIARLGGNARFVGKAGADDHGDLFESKLKKNNVLPHLLKSSSPTGKVLSIITPDAQRSLFTFLGASSETMPEEITSESLHNSLMVHIEGYLLFNEELMSAALNTAKNVGARISLDLASYTIVEQFNTILGDIVDEYVDILIANEDEARVFTGFADEEKAIDSLSKRADIAVLKVGERGSYIAKKGEIIKIEPWGSEGIVDTTGAGDLWASGFLFGLANGYSLEKSGNIGSACGYEVCRVVGAHIPDEGWDRIINILEE